ncbi:MAG TPA: hypothetical protein VFN44_08575 [Solirubrobacteraceae bacterium]|nr:hypothetical protein [Solirubrobacteraceae bacterium]
MTPAVRSSAIALAALALLPATASAATVTVTGDDGNPLAINSSAATAIRNMDVQYAVTFGSADAAYHKTTVVGPDGAAASSGSSCYPKSAITDVSRYVDYRGNGDYAVVVQTFTNSACTTGAKEARFLFSINAGTSITPPGGIVLTRQPNSFSTITHRVPVALNPGAVAYEVRYARGGVIGPDGAISGPSTDAFLDRNTGLADARFTEPGQYVMVARMKSGDYYSPWSAPISFTVKAPFDLAYVGFPDPDGPSYKLRGTLRDAFARGGRVTVYYAKGRKGGKFRRLGRSSKINGKKAFTLRFTLRKPGVYRLQYRFKGSSLVVGGQVTEAIRIRRTIRFG